MKVTIYFTKDNKDTIFLPRIISIIFLLPRIVTIYFTKGNKDNVSFNKDYKDAFSNILIKNNINGSFAYINCRLHHW